MNKVNVFEAKAKLSEYLDRAARGERIVICRHNRPVAELRAVSAVRTEPRPLGPLPGRPTFNLPASFFDPLADDELEQWDTVRSADPLSPGWTAPAAHGAGRVAETTAAPYGAKRRRIRLRRTP